MAVGGNGARRRQVEPLLIEGAHVSPCYAYRDQAPNEPDEAYVARLAAELEATIQELGPQSVIAFVAEPVVGATMGAVPPVPGYFRAVRAICDRYGMLLILDEVMCGMGRTGTLFACEQEGVRPDLVTIAKGLGAGYQAIGATLATRAIYDAIVAGSGFFQHGYTYMAHPTACAAGLAVQQAIVEEQLLGRVREQGARLRELLLERFGGHVHVGDIRGRGRAEALARGLMVYAMGGTIDGQRGDHIVLAPPFIVTGADLEVIVDRLAAALDAALARPDQAAA